MSVSVSASWNASFIQVSMTAEVSSFLRSVYIATTGLFGSAVQFSSVHFSSGVNTALVSNFVADNMFSCTLTCNFLNMIAICCRVHVYTCTREHL